MTFTHALPTNNYGPAKFIVDASAANGTHTTIASALTSASSGDTIFLRPGTYTENITLKAGVDIVAYIADALTPNVTILGTCSASYSGVASMSGIALQTNGSSCVSMTGANPTALFLRGCSILSNGNTPIINSSSGGGGIAFFDCDNTAGASDAFFTLTNSGGISIINSYFSGGATAATSTATGSNAISIHQSLFDYPVSTSGTATLSIINSQMVMQGNLIAVTCGGSTGNDLLINCFVASGTSSCISISSGATLNVCNCILRTSNTNVLTGAGTLKYALISFLGTSSGHNVTTETPLATLI